MKKKIIAICLVALFVFSSAATAFSATTDISNDNQPMYFAMGDSVSSGCKMAGTQNAYEAYKTMSDSETKYSLFVSPVDGKKHDHWYINAVPYSFVSKFARSINASEESMNGAHPGLRPKDYCYILGLIDKSEFEGDVIAGDDFSVNERIAQYNSAEGYKYAIANADVITIQLGENDISEYMFKNTEKLIELIWKLAATSKKEETGALKEMQEDLIDIENADTEEDVNRCVVSFFSELAKLKETSKTFIEIVDFLAKSITKSAVDVRRHWNLLMKYVYEHKKDDAVVIATTVFPPFIGLENHTEMLQFLVDSMGEGIDLDKLAELLTKVFDPFVADMNNFYRSLSLKYDYTIADVPKLELISVVTGEYDPYDNVYLDTPVTYLLHPNHKESDKILEAVQEAYKNAMVKKGKKVVYEDVESEADKCKHINSEIKNVVEATYLNEGYTGDKICTDCGRFFYKGEKTAKIKLTKPAIKKLTRGKRNFTVKWGTLKNVTGYNVQYSTSPKFGKNNKTLTIASRDTGSKKVSNLKIGKKYYVRVRAYKNVRNRKGKTVKVYSSWTAKKSITTK